MVEMSWIRFDGTIAYGVSATGELLEIHRLRDGRGWRIVAHVDPEDGGQMVECHWDCSDAGVVMQMFRDFLGIRHRPRRRTWMHPAQGEEDPHDG